MENEQKRAPRSVQRIPELDGLRVLMIFLVSWYHIWQQSWLPAYIGRYSLDYLLRSGYVWVDGTVLLSSFLLFLPYARAMRDRSPAPDTRAFYLRRVKRILPGYYFLLLAVFFGIALPWRLYTSAPFMVKDLATHFTFTFTFFRDTNMGTQLGGASWTLAVEVQAYVLFPLVARGVMKKPVLTFACMLLLCFGFRAWCLWALTDYSMVVNQLLNFLDVYVIGMCAAMLFCRGEHLLAAPPEGTKAKTAALRIAATAVFVLCFYGLLQMLRLQARSQGYDRIQANQMMFRPVFALCFAALALSAPFSLRPLRFLLGNPVTRFLAGISMNYYLTHQIIIVHLKRLGIPPSVSETPNMAGEQPWQNQYTALAFGLSLLAAVLVTYLVEKPGARLITRLTSSSPSPSHPESSRSEQMPAS